MSAIEIAIEKVKQLDEAQARQLLAWLQHLGGGATVNRQPAGAIAMLGFARRFRAESRSTNEWMKELRAGESE
jgi:hypothetical protein